eukprot:g23414.t1
MNPSLAVRWQDFVWQLRPMGRVISTGLMDALGTGRLHPRLAQKEAYLMELLLKAHSTEFASLSIDPRAGNARGPEQRALR